MPSHAQAPACCLREPVPVIDDAIIKLVATWIEHDGFHDAPAIASAARWLTFCTVHNPRNTPALERGMPVFFEVFRCHRDPGEQFIGAFTKLEDATGYAQAASKTLHAEYIVRGPMDGDPYAQIFIHAIYVDGEEVEDCDHS